MVCNLSLWINDLSLSSIGLEGDIEEMEVSGRLSIDVSVILELSG